MMLTFLGLSDKLVADIFFFLWVFQTGRKSGVVLHTLPDNRYETAVWRFGQCMPNQDTHANWRRRAGERTANKAGTEEKVRKIEKLTKS